MSAEAWSALVSAIGVITAIVLQIWEWRRAGFSRGIEMIAALDARFESPEIRAIRRRAAAYLQNPSEADVEGKEAANTMVNFFESLGFLYARRAIDAEAIWHFFSSWLLPYYAATKALRAEQASDDPNVFSEFEKVYKTVKTIEEARHPTHDTLHIIGPEALKGFLVEETGLPMKAPPSTVPLP